MKEYIKPVVETTKATAEGVYAASGYTPWVGDGLSGCNSQAMRGNFQNGTFTKPATVKEYYGCYTCRAFDWSVEGGGCQVKTGKTTKEDDGYRYPTWELQCSPNQKIEIEDNAPI